jgi:hypothetical protein
LSGDNYRFHPLAAGLVLADSALGSPGAGGGFAVSNLGLSVTEWAKYATLYQVGVEILASLGCQAIVNALGK